MKIKDYLLLKDIESFLKEEKEEKISENNGFYTIKISKIDKLLKKLEKFIDSIENDN